MGTTEEMSKTVTVTIPYPVTVPIPRSPDPQSDPLVEFAKTFLGENESLFVREEWNYSKSGLYPQWTGSLQFEFRSRNREELAARFKASLLDREVPGPPVYHVDGESPS